MKLPENLSIGNIENYSSTVKAARKILKEHKKEAPKDIDTYRLRTGKTIYCFTNFQRLKNKLKQLDTCEYDFAEPGQSLPTKKLKL